MEQGDEPGAEEAEEDHSNVGEDGDNDAGAVNSSEEGQVENQERGCQCPLQVVGPEDLSPDVLFRRDASMLVMFNVSVMDEGASTAGCHGEICNCSHDGHESDQDVEETFLHWSSPC